MLLLLLLIQSFLLFLLLLLQLLRLPFVLLLHLLFPSRVRLLLLELLVLLLLLLLDPLAFLLLFSPQLFLLLLLLPILLSVAFLWRSGACRRRRHLVGMHRGPIRLRRLRWAVGQLSRAIGLIRFRRRIRGFFRWPVCFGWLRRPIRFRRLSRLTGVGRVSGLRLIRLRLTRLSAGLSRPVRLTSAIRLCSRWDGLRCRRSYFYRSWACGGNGLTLFRLGYG